jgi:hypothetical protein
LLVMQGQAPYQIDVRWVYGPPLPVGLDHETRQAMIRKRVAEIFERTSATATGTGIAGGARATRPTWDGAPAGFT